MFKPVQVQLSLKFARVNLNAAQLRKLLLLAELDIHQLKKIPQGLDHIFSLTFNWFDISEI